LLPANVNNTGVGSGEYLERGSGQDNIESRVASATNDFHLHTLAVVKDLDVLSASRVVVGVGVVGGLEAFQVILGETSCESTAGKVEATGRQATRNEGGGGALQDDRIDRALRGGDGNSSEREKKGSEEHIEE